MKLCTDIKQSKKLMELGIDVNTADMYWWYSGKRYYVESMDDDDFNKESDIPAWSLTALFNIIPKKINFGYENDSTFVLKPLENGKYLADYYEVSFVKDNPIDAVFEMVCWLLENEKI